MTTENIKQVVIQEVEQGIATLERRLEKRENSEWSSRLEYLKISINKMRNISDNAFWADLKGQDAIAIAIAVATEDFQQFPIGVQTRLLTAIRTANGE